MPAAGWVGKAGVPAVWDLAQNGSVPPSNLPSDRAGAVLLVASNNLDPYYLTTNIYSLLGLCMISHVHI